MVIVMLVVLFEMVNIFIKPPKMNLSNCVTWIFTSTCMHKCISDILNLLFICPICYKSLLHLKKHFQLVYYIAIANIIFNITVLTSENWIHSNLDIV